MHSQFDATADGRRLKFQNVIDEHSRFCLAIRVGSRCKAKDEGAVRVRDEFLSSQQLLRPRYWPTGGAGRTPLEAAQQGVAA